MYSVHLQTWALQVGVVCCCFFIPCLLPQNHIVKRKLIFANNFSQIGQGHIVEETSQCSTNHLYLKQCSILYRQEVILAKLFWTQKHEINIEWRMWAEGIYHGPVVCWLQVLRNKQWLNPAIAGWGAKDLVFQDKSKKSDKCLGPCEILKRSDLQLCGFFHKYIFSGIVCVHRKWVFQFLLLVMQTHTGRSWFMPSFTQLLWSPPFWIHTSPSITALMYSQKSRWVNIKWALYFAFVTELGCTASWPKFWSTGMCKAPKLLHSACLAADLQ